MVNYILNDDHSVSPTNDILEWAKAFENSNRIVAKDAIGDTQVSTVFLGLNHNFSGGPPLLFETMIFGGEHDDYQERYSTYEEALEGHQAAIKLVKGEGNE